MKKQLRNRYIEKFETFCAVVLSILASIESNFENLKNILSLKFGII
jgi:hypothetical protein